MVKSFYEYSDDSIDGEKDYQNFASKVAELFASKMKGRLVDYFVVELCYDEGCTPMETVKRLLKTGK